MNRCRHCGVPIRWAWTAKHGRAMPLDIEPTVLGNVVLRPEDGAAVVLDTPDRDRAVERGEVIYRPHFASCPHHQRRADAGVR